MLERIRGSYDDALYKSTYTYFTHSVLRWAEFRPGPWIAATWYQTRAQQLLEWPTLAKRRWQFC